MTVVALGAEIVTLALMTGHTEFAATGLLYSLLPPSSVPPFPILPLSSLLPLLFFFLLSHLPPSSVSPPSQSTL